MTKQLTREQAVAFHDSGAWKEMSFRDRAVFQMHQDKLCMPFSTFHEAMEKALGRPVFKHEFGLNRVGLEKELMGEQPAPTFDEIMGLIPIEKRLLILCTPSTSQTSKE